MKHLLIITLLAIVPIVALPQQYNKASGTEYNHDKKYTPNELKEDFLFVRKTLEQTHPRLYEYTPKPVFDHFLDSLYAGIDQPMTEREFHYYMLPVINKVHCSHTKLMSSAYLASYIDQYYKAPPFLPYFTAEKMYIKSNYSSDTSLKPGAEIISINGISASDIHKSFLNRMTNEGKNITFMYNRMNTAFWPPNGYFGLFPGICDYPMVDTYTITFTQPDNNQVNTAYLAAIPYNSYPPIIIGSTKPKTGFDVAENKQFAVLSISSFVIPTHQFKPYLDSVFNILDTGRIANLIIDLRGNLGGFPEASAELLSRFMQKEFVYFKEGNGYDELKKPLQPSPNRYKGKVLILTDGACRSSTGHFLALAKYYNIGTMIGEEACASYSCNDNGKPFTLPHSQLILQCSGGVFTVDVKGLVRGNGIKPDYEVAPTISDVIKGKDVVLEYAVGMATKRIK